MSDATVRLLFFAAARDVVGVREIAFAVQREQSVRELFDRILEAYPALAAHRRSLRMAINGEYARDNDVVRAGDEVALIPPVAGGST